MANNTGLAVGKHKGTLAIARVGNPDDPQGEMPARLKIPVTFVVLPADSGRVTAPGVRDVAILSRPKYGQEYGVGEAIDVQVYFSRPVEVTGSPTLAIGLGEHTRQLRWAGRGWGIDAPCGGVESLRFSYVVQPGDRDTDGVGIAANALKLNGGSIRNVAGVDAILDLGVHAIADDADHKVDGSG